MRNKAKEKERQRTDPRRDKIGAGESAEERKCSVEAMQRAVQIFKEVSLRSGREKESRV